MTGKVSLSERLIHSFLHAVPLRSSLRIPCSRIDLDPERTSSIRPAIPASSTVAKRRLTWGVLRQSKGPPELLLLSTSLPLDFTLHSSLFHCYVGGLVTDHSVSSDGCLSSLYIRCQARVGLRRFNRTTQLASARRVSHGHPEFTRPFPSSLGVEADDLTFNLVDKVCRLVGHFVNGDGDDTSRLFSLGF